MIRSFSEVLYIDNFHIHEYRVCNTMESATRYSVVCVVQTTSMEYAINVIYTCWISPIWSPKEIICILIFKTRYLIANIRNLEFKTRIPSIRQRKNVLEVKHYIIRYTYIFIRVEHEEVSLNISAVLVQRSIRISNDLYGNSTMS